MTRVKKCLRGQKKVIPSGVNSPVRAFKSVNGDPLCISRAKGSHFWDIDGNEYIDYVCSWGPLILGHAHPGIVQTVKDVAENGTSFGANCEIEAKIAEKIVDLVPGIEKIRMVSSGTEAAMSAVRLARGYTGRSKIIKFEGCYHGHADSFLSKAGSGAMTFGIPGTPGVTKGTIEDTLDAVYNDLSCIEKIIGQNEDNIAAIIIEPVAGNMGVILPQEGFLEGLRKLADLHGILLIFDEVITGFRVGPGGAQQHYNITPDLTILGKIIGGGLPVGAFGGAKHIMDHLAPDGPVYQAGTLSGNPLALSAGYATLLELEKEGFYEKLEIKASGFFNELRSNFEHYGFQCTAHDIGSMAGFFFQEGPVNNYTEAARSDTELFARYFHGLLDKGIYIAPSQFEAMFVSSAHTGTDLDKTLEIHKEVLKGL